MDLFVHNMSDLVGSNIEFRTSNGTHLLVFTCIILVFLLTAAYVLNKIMVVMEIIPVKYKLTYLFFCCRI